MNKQYSKEDYSALIPKIIEHMNAMPYQGKSGRAYGAEESLPSELSPFAYNETIANEYFPLTEDEARTQGYAWRIVDKKTNIATLSTAQIPENISEVSDDILKETIGCEHAGNCSDNCTVAFRLTQEELTFYKRMNIAVPRICSICRHYTRLKERNPMRLWHRICQCTGTGSSNGIYRNIGNHAHGNTSCVNEFETPYAPEREEIIYCEPCHQKELE